MKSPWLREFDKQLRSDVVPFLAEHGFAFGADRTFRRAIDHEGTRSTQLVNFQVGHKGSLIGRFTVNLAVFNPDFLPEAWPLPDGEVFIWHCMFDLSQRLGFFRTPDRKFLDRVLKRQRQPRDHWWEQSGELAVMSREFREVMYLLLVHGFDWLGTRTSVAAFHWALRQLARRKEWKAALGSPGVPAYWTPEPFPEPEPTGEPGAGER